MHLFIYTLYICVCVCVTSTSCRICQINGICSFGEITTPSCGVRSVLIPVPLLCRMYQFSLCGRVEQIVMWDFWPVKYVPRASRGPLEQNI